MSRWSRINLLVWRYFEGQRYCHDLAWELVGIVQIFDHHLIIDAEEGVYNGLRDDAFDARDIEVHGEEKEIQDEDVTIMLWQSKGGKSFPHQSVKLYFDCGKPGHIARFTIKHKIIRKKLQRIRKMVMIMHLQFVMEHISRTCANGLWIREHPNTWLRIGPYSTHMR